MQTRSSCAWHKKKPAAGRPEELRVRFCFCVHASRSWREAVACPAGCSLFLVSTGAPSLCRDYSKRERKKNLGSRLYMFVDVNMYIYL